MRTKLNLSDKARDIYECLKKGDSVSGNKTEPIKELLKLKLAKQEGKGKNTIFKLNLKK